MSNDLSSKIGLDEVVAAAGQGALRALAARDIVPDSGQGFFIEMHIRCGIPPYIRSVIPTPVENPEAGSFDEIR